MRHNCHSSVQGLFARCFGLLFIVFGAAQPIFAATSVTLAWDANPEPDIAGYRLHYGITSGEYPTTIDVGNAMTVTTPDLVPGVTYHFVVTAYNTAALESLPSNEASFTATAIDPDPNPDPEPLPIVFGGSYSGASIGNPPQQNIKVQLKVNEKGRFTGKLLLGMNTYSLRGKLDPDGTAVVALPISDSVILQAELRVDPIAGTIQVTVTDAGDGVTVTLTQSSFSKTNKAPQAGNYTLMIGEFIPSDGPTSIAAPAQVGNSGVATVIIRKNGKVRIVGRRADGEKFVTTSVLEADGSFPMYLADGDALTGPIFVRNTDNISDGDGEVRWTKHSDSSSGIPPEVTSGTMTAVLSRFDPASLTRDGKLLRNIEISGGDIPEEMDPIEQPIKITSILPLAGVGRGPERLAFRIDSLSGLVRGSFIHPLDHQKKKIWGVVFQKQGVVAGFFAGPTTTGSFIAGGLPDSPDGQ